MTRQASNPDVRLIETDSGEVTLEIDGRQAMQAWERDLMWASADLLCRFGSEFLEVGLGLGLSALRIAENPRTVRHTVVEKYPRVVELFDERHPVRPPTLQVVIADFLDYVEQLETAALDGIFFDPAIPNEVSSDPALWERMMPLVVRSLRPGGAFIPFFSTRPVLRWPFYLYFDRVVVHRHSFTAYKTTNYTYGRSGNAFIQCFVRDR